MLAELKIKLEGDSKELNCYHSSNLQGVLMEHIKSEYASLLHHQKINPYSQFLNYDKGYCWIIHTMTEEAYKEIILPILSPDFTSFDIKKKDIHVEIKDKELKILPKRSLLEEFYSSDSREPFYTFEFRTPTAFKQNGRYVNYPDIRLLFQSLMNKYSINSDMDMFDNETLEQLTKCISLSRYHLHSTFFPLEGIKIPAFMGHMTIHIHGSKTMENYVKLLLRFGEYSGIGIKTAMGMGAIRIKEKEKV